MKVSSANDDCNVCLCIPALSLFSFSSSLFPYLSALFLSYSLLPLPLLRFSSFFLSLTISLISSLFFFSLSLFSPALSSLSLLSHLIIIYNAHVVKI